MKYIINPAGNRIVKATPEETRALRPSIAASLRCRRLPDGQIEDFCQEVEIVTWKAIEDQRIVGNEFARPVDALLNFMLSVAWNVWRNHSRRRYVRCEALVDDFPDIVGPSPEGRLDARETLLNLSTHPDITRILLDAINVPFAERHRDVTRGIYCSQLVNARKWARDVDAGHWKAPRQPVPPKLKHRKKQR